MFSATNQQIALHEDLQLPAGLSGTHENIRSHFSFDPEFSLPSYFFDKDFLDNADLCEPHATERRQPESDLPRKRIRLPEESQEYRC